MKCALCGYVFNEKDAKASCKGCLMAGGCNLIRCPNCGYETPKEPKWLNPVRNKISSTKNVFLARISNGVKKILKSLPRRQAGRDKDGIDRKS